MLSIVASVLTAHECGHQFCSFLFAPSSSNIYGLKNKKVHQNNGEQNYTEVSHVLQALNMRRSECSDFFVQVSLFARGCRRFWKNETCHETFFPPFFFFLIYSDELIKPLLSCHKRLWMDIWYKSKWCKKVKSGYSSPAQLSLPFLLTLHQPRLPRLCLPVCLAFRCDVSRVFSQTPAVTLWTAAARTLMVFHCCIPQVILNLQLALFKSFSWDVCFKECVNS